MLKYSNYKYLKDFSDLEVISIIEDYTNHKGIISVEEYIEEISITRYMYKKLLERYKKICPNNKIKPEYITVSGLIEKRNWTKSMANKLLENVEFKEVYNYNYAVYSKLYNLIDIFEIEKTEKFKELMSKANKRKISAIKANETKRIKQAKRAMELEKEEIEDLQNKIEQMLNKFNSNTENRTLIKNNINIKQINTVNKQNNKIKLNNIEKVKWQEDCNKIISNKDNVILSSPTGSGKTIVYLKWALSKNQRTIYITSPIKSLANQRYRELKKLGYIVGIETGDIKNVPQNCDFICCTQEIYTNKYVDDEEATVIIDEFHYIFENYERTRTYIDCLKNTKAHNIMICSATLGNDIKKLSKYIDSLTNREFYTYTNGERLTELKYKQKINKKDIQNALVFAFSTINCKKIAQQLIEEREKTEKDNIKHRNKKQLRFDKIKVFAQNQKVNLENLE